MTVLEKGVEREGETSDSDELVKHEAGQKVMDKSVMCFRVHASSPAEKEPANGFSQQSTRKCKSLA